MTPLSRTIKKTRWHRKETKGLYATLLIDLKTFGLRIHKGILKMPGGAKGTDTDRYLPNTIHQAIMLLVFYLSASDKRKITRLTEDDLADLDFSLGWFIKNEFKLVTNDALIESCRVTSSENTVDADQASGIIIKALWKRLKMLQYQDLIR